MQADCLIGFNPHIRPLDHPQAKALTLALLPVFPLLTALGALAVLPAPAVLELAALLVPAALPSPYLLSSSATIGFVVLEKGFKP